MSYTITRGLIIYSCIGGNKIEKFSQFVPRGKHCISIIHNIMLYGEVIVFVLRDIKITKNAQ